MTHRRRSVLCIAIGAVAASVASQEALHGQGAVPTRADVAAAYLAFEEAYAAADLSGPFQRYVHRGFDYAASLFFSGRFTEAVERLNEMALLVEQQASGNVHDRSAEFARSLQVQFSPPAVVLGEPLPRPVRARLRSMYDVGGAQGQDVDIVLQLVDAQGNVAWQQTTTATRERSTFQTIVQLNDLPGDLDEGTYTALVGVADAAPPHRAGRLLIVKEPIAARRARLLERLDAVAASLDNDAELHRAAAICRARLEVLTDQPSPLRSIEFLLDPVLHARALGAEIDSLSAGRNPYRNLAGEHWRVVQRAGGDSPVMVYAPAAAETGQPLPLVIALHGAGGDEALFMRAYGAGMIRDLAESRNFIVASPLTYHVMGDGPLIDRVIQDMAADYAIDRRRIYLIGHSLGGGTITGVLNANPERFAAACCIAGAGRFTAASNDEEYPAVLILAAELDTIITPKRLRDSTEAAIARGLPIEYRLMESMGHVLVVNETLEMAVDWLLQHERDSN